MWAGQESDGEREEASGSCRTQNTGRQPNDGREKEQVQVSPGSIQQSSDVQTSGVTLQDTGRLSYLSGKPPHRSTSSRLTPFLL